MNLAENLKKIRKEHNLSQEQLAEKLNVSRQSVSKWESNQAYPELDKIIQISKMFNINIDTLLNQDVKEINNENQSKNNINKYIDSFLAYITKTIKMFSNMSFKEKCKCIIEEFIILFTLIIIFLIIGTIASTIINKIFSCLPNNIYYVIYNILNGLYLIGSTVLIIILLLHIFKIRYLNYYEIVNEEPKKILNENKIILEKQPERIIIRDPKHSEYKFINGLLKCILFFIKLTCLSIIIPLCFSLITLSISLIISFLIIKTKAFFIGILLTILSAIIINVIILIILFNFILNRKSNKKILLVIFITCLIGCGIGIGITIINSTDFNYINDFNNKIYSNDEFTVPMTDNLKIHEDYYDEIEYIEENRDDLRIVYTHSKYFNITSNSFNDGFIDFYLTNDNNNFFEIVRLIINDINNKEIVNYSKYKIYIYTSDTNIKKIKANNKEYNNHINELNYN